jgi:Amt family ammonium transporter
VFILWFCWFGFNGMSTLGVSDEGLIESAGLIFVNTNMAAACAAISSMIYTWVRYKKPDISMTLNGALAGLVGITAGCDAVSTFGAFLIGLACGVAVVLGIEFIDKVLKIDDPVGAIGVHGVCGALGTIFVGLLATDGGLFYGGGAAQLGVQLVGVVAVAAWVGVTMFIAFTVIKNTVGLRVAEEEELSGLDITEHGLESSYADFMPVNGVPSRLSVPLADSRDPSAAPAVPVGQAVPVVDTSTPARPGESKITLLSIVMQQSKFEAFKAAMQKIGVNGMTVTQVLGYGMQKGSTDEYYRGVPIDAQLLPKVKVDVVVCKVPVPLVIDTAKKALYTGRVGDGKIFVQDVEDVVKVRTGEVGFDALQDDLAYVLFSSPKRGPEKGLGFQRHGLALEATYPGELEDVARQAQTPKRPGAAPLNPFGI